MNIWPGAPYSLGATYDGGGTNFALFSEVADRVELCLFDGDGNETRIDLPEREALVWHGYIPRVVPGQHYGYRVPILEQRRRRGQRLSSTVDGVERQVRRRPVRPAGHVPVPARSMLVLQEAR